MKHCTNPACNTNYMFSDRYTLCPFCRQPLAGTNEQEQTQTVEEEPFFIQRGRKITCQGRVIEMDTDSVFQTKKQKLFQTFWYGEPYQMSQQSVHTVLCIEEMQTGMAGQVKDFTMYGSITGKVHVGDEVRLQAKDVGDQRVITSLYNGTTQSQVHARLLIPACFFRWLMLSLILLFLVLVYMIYDFFHSGAAAAFASVIIGPVAICGIICYGIYSAIRSAFPRRNKRRGGWFL